VKLENWMLAPVLHLAAKRTRPPFNFARKKTATRFLFATKEKPPYV
jgi:hypothetical protein